MLRFDPTRAEHNKFVEPKVKKRKTKASNEPESKRRKTDDDYYDEGKKAEDNEPPVSMEHFYEVRGDLKKSMGSGGFSLLSMFNRPVENSQTTPADKPYEEKLIAKHGVKFLADFDPFKYDSSGDEADADGSKKKINTEAKPESDGMKSGLKYESFFVLNANDDRVSGEYSNWTYLFLVNTSIESMKIKLNHKSLLQCFRGCIILQTTWSGWKWWKQYQRLWRCTETRAEEYCQTKD